MIRPLHRITLALGLALAAPAFAQDGPKTLDELLEQVRQGSERLTAEEQAREQAFIRQKERQADLLAEARAEEQRLINQSAALERQYEDNEKLAVEFAETLRQRMGTSGELFGVVRQVAGDTRGHIAASIISSQLTGREEPLAELAQSKSLPTIDALEDLWFIMTQEMAAQGEVVRFTAPVIGADGQTVPQEVVRVGPFNAIQGERFLQWLPEVDTLAVLGRQPQEMHQDTARALAAAGPDQTAVRFAIDPSRGAVLSMLVQTPDLEERIELGGVVGYATLVLGAVAGVYGLLRLLYLFVVGLLVTVQRRRVTSPSRWNPLGRVIRTWQQQPDVDVETLERRLDDAILKETGRLERGHWLIKVVSVVAPLMGLLGTVTGMIQTFQAITLFGTGDPKLMAGGISEALVTTMIGLIVAIPLVLLYSGVSNIARRVIDLLYEQATGLIARQSERAEARSA